MALTLSYRTGKSFFLNQLTRNATTEAAATAATRGFQVGPTTESCTRGIWLWDPQPPLRNARGHKVLLMDTEGIAATDNDETYDAKIFSLGLLLSSLFVFNTMGVIDEGAIDRLYLVSELTKHICVSAADSPPVSRSVSKASMDLEDDSESSAALAHEEAPVTDPKDLAPHFPPLVWLLRDFVLDLRAADGAELTANEYLENSLATRRDSVSRRQDDRNSLRECVKALFTQRECLTLVRPVMDEAQLRRASELLDKDLRPEFVAQMHSIRQRILSIVMPKQLFGKVMDGRKVAHMVRCYTQTMNSGAVPDLRAAWSYVSEATCQTAMMAAMENYDRTMAAASGGEQDQLLGQPEFEKLHKDAQESALNVFKRQSIEGSARAACFQKLKQHTQRQRTALIAELQRRSTAVCEQVLVSLRNEFLQQPAANGQWDLDLDSSTDSAKQQLNGFKTHMPSFEETMDALEHRYELLAQGPSKKIVFYQFLRTDMIAFFQLLTQRHMQQCERAQTLFHESIVRLQHEREIQAAEAVRVLQARDMDITDLKNKLLLIEQREKTQADRMRELEQALGQQQISISNLEERKRVFKAQLETSTTALRLMEGNFEKTKQQLELQRQSADAQTSSFQEIKSDLQLQLENARTLFQRERDELMQRLNDVSTENTTLQMQAALKDNEREQDQERHSRELESLRSRFEREVEARLQAEEQCTQIKKKSIANESLKQTATTEIAAHRQQVLDAEREKKQLLQRVERLQTQLGRLNGEHQVAIVLNDCIAEVVRQADVEKHAFFQEERELLQTKLSELYLKITTLPDFYQREIFCSPEPTPDFFQSLTS